LRILDVLPASLRLHVHMKVVDSQWAGIERPLAYPEAKRKLQSL
jgi:hypothetical protein